MISENIAETNLEWYGLFRVAGNLRTDNSPPLLSWNAYVCHVADVGHEIKVLQKQKKWTDFFHTSFIHL